MDLTIEYLSKICPELLESEIVILKENLLDLYNPRDIYPQVVRVTAKSLFPHIVTNEQVVSFLDGRDRIAKAIEFLKAAHNQLDKIPRLSDNCGMAMIEMSQWTHYLNEELRELEKGNAKEQ
jgi:hypothetical protein